VVDSVRASRARVILGVAEPIVGAVRESPELGTDVDEAVHASRADAFEMAEAVDALLDYRIQRDVMMRLLRMAFGATAEQANDAVRAGLAVRLGNNGAPRPSTPAKGTRFALLSLKRGLLQSAKESPRLPQNPP
jgi:hypothetical protein